MGETTMTADATYAFAREDDGGVARLGALEAIFDTTTTRHIAARGVAPGWTCLEIGGGGGSIVKWLASRVGPSGRVVATDLNTRFLEGLELPNVEVLRHDIASEPLPEDTFDLVHARLVLMHVANASAALGHMIRALKPGGWILLEEFEVTPIAMTTLSSVELSNANTTFALRHVMERAGMDLRFGRRLPDLLDAHGLIEIDAEGRICLWRGRSSGTDLLRANYQAFRSPILETLLVTPQEFDRDMRNLDEPRFATSSPVMWTVAGRKPSPSLRHV